MAWNGKAEKRQSQNCKDVHLPEYELTLMHYKISNLLKKGSGIQKGLGFVDPTL